MSFNFNPLRNVKRPSLTSIALRKLIRNGTHLCTGDSIEYFDTETENDSRYFDMGAENIVSSSYIDLLDSSETCLLVYYCRL